MSTSVALYLIQVCPYDLGVNCVSKKIFGKGFFLQWTEGKGSRDPEEVGNTVLAFL